MHEIVCVFSTNSWVSFEVDLAGVQRLQPGQTTSKFHRLDPKYLEHKHLSFSLILLNGKSVDVLCKSEEQYNAWKQVS